MTLAFEPVEVDPDAGPTSEGAPAPAVTLRSARTVAEASGRSGHSSLTDDSLSWRSVWFALDFVCLTLPAVLLPVLTRAGAGRYTSVMVALVIPLVSLGLLGAGDRRRGDVSPTSDVTALGKAVGLAVLAAIAIDEISGSPLGGKEALIIGAVAIAMLAVARLTFAAWLGAARVRGRHLMRVLLVGTGEDAFELWSHIAARPDSGYVVVGAVGDPEEATSHDWDVPLVGSVFDTIDAAQSCGARVALVPPAALDVEQLNELVRRAPEHDLQLQLSPGLDHVATRRLLPAPIARVPLFQVSANEPPSWQVSVKRLLDVAAAALLLVLALPVLAVSALAVRLSDRGPILFRQQRVGKGGRVFDCLKLRTMTCDAEERLDDLREHNERSGPLFKVDDDPRITRVGRVLRALSIDELPQLWNVLAGEMSLVGPRPALPDEVAQFDAKLARRNDVLPGITGLWQVEARDNPDFTAYRDLDLYYVDNWSLGLDLAVLFVTVPSVIGRGVRGLARRARRD